MFPNKHDQILIKKYMPFDDNGGVKKERNKDTDQHLACLGAQNVCVLNIDLYSF